MMDNYSRTQELLSHATNSAGASNKQYEKTMDSLEAKLNQLKNAWDTFTMDIARSDLIKGVVDLLTNLLTAVNNLTGAFGSFSGVAKLVTAFLGFKMVQPVIVGLTADMVNFAKTMAGAGEAQKGFEGGVIKGFSNLKKALFNKETWFGEGKQAGIAAEQGVQAGIQEAEQAAKVTKTVAKEVKQVSSEIKIVKENTEKYDRILKNINKTTGLSGKKAKELAHCYKIEGIAAKEVYEQIKDGVINLKDEKEIEEVISRILNERSQVTQKVVESTEKQTKAKVKETIATNSNTDALKNNNNETKLGILTRAKYTAQLLSNDKAVRTEAAAKLSAANANKAFVIQLLFGNKTMQKEAATALTAAGANEALVASFTGMAVPLGVVVFALASAVALWKSIAIAATENERKERENAKAIIENTKAIKEEVDSLTNLEKTYQNALSAYDDTIESKREYREATLELARALGVEIKATDILEGNTKKIGETITQAEAAKREEINKTLKTRLAAQETLIKDAKDNSWVGSYQQWGIGILTPLDSAMSFLYNKQSYSEYQAQQKEAEEGRKETLKQLQENIAQDAILQAKLQSGTETGAKTYDEYLSFRKALTKNIVEMEASEEEVQKALAEIVSDTEYGYEITYEAQRDFKQRVESFGGIDTKNLDAFLSMVEKAGDTSSLKNINLFEASEIGLEKAYENAKGLSKTLENLTLGNSFVDVVEELVNGTDFDSLSDELKNEFNSELAKTKDILDETVTAQEQWNKLLAKNPSNIQKTKYLLELSKKSLERQKTETEKLQKLEKERQDTIKKNRDYVNSLSRETIWENETLFSRKEKEIGLSILTFSSKQQEIEETKKLQEDRAKRGLTNESEYYQRRIDKLESESKSLTTFLLKYTGEYKDFANDPNKWIGNIDTDLEKLNSLIKEQGQDLPVEDLNKIVNAMGELGDLKNYLIKVQEYYQNEAELMSQFEGISYSTEYQDLKIEQLTLKEAEIEKAVFSNTNLESFFKFKEEAQSGNIPTELSDEVKDILSEVPALSAGFANALEEWEYFIVNLSGEKVNDFLNNISNMITDRAIEVVSSSGNDQKLVLNAQAMMSEIEKIAQGDIFEQTRSAMANSALVDFDITELSSVKDVLLALNSLTEDQIKDLNMSGKEFKQLQKYAKEYANSLDVVNTKSNQLSKTNYGLKNSADALKAIDSSIDDLASTIETLSDLLSKIGEDFTISAEDAREFAKVFPEILNNATVTSDGIVHLNETEVQSFIEGKQKEVQLDAKAINDRIDSQVKVLEAKREINQRELQSFRDNKEKLNKLDSNSKKFLIDNSNLFYEHARNSGAQEVVDTYSFLRQDNAVWAKYLSGVDKMNQDFYSNIVWYKRLEKAGIDAKNIDTTQVSTDVHGKHYYGNDEIDNDTYEAIFKVVKGIKSGGIKNITISDVIKGLNQTKPQDTSKDIDIQFKELLEEYEQALIDQDEAYAQDIATLISKKINTKGLSVLGKNLSIGGGGGEGEDKFKNTLDRLYNLLQDLETETETLQRLENEYNTLLEKRNVTGKEIYANLQAQKASLIEQRRLQKKIAAGRNAEIESIFKEIPSLKNYVAYDSNTGKIQVNQSNLNKITDKDFGDKILDGINRIEDAAQKAQDAKNALFEINEKIDEINERGIDEYVSLENRTLEAIKKQRQDVIDHLSEVNNSINEANSKLMETVRENINKIRQDRQNEKTQNEISDLQGQLAAMAARTDIDTETNKEYLNLQKSLKEKTENYQDTLIDQKLSTMEEDNKKAQEQRERQIKLLEKHLEIDEESGVLMAEAQKLLNEGIGPNGSLIKTSDLVQLLKNAENYEGLSNIEKMKWLEDLEQKVASGIAGVGNKNQLENLSTKKGTKIEFTDGAGNKHIGTVGAKGLVSVNENGKVLTYSDVYRNEAGQYETFEAKKVDTAATTTKNTTSKTQGARSEKEYYGVALATINGNYGWGTGEERNKKYKEKGFDAQKVQNLINSGLALSNPYNIKDLSQFDYKKYYTGGLADYTGLAWLDGTKSNPEAVLNAAQTKAFISLIDNQKKLLERGGTTNIGGQTNIEVNVNVGQIANDYDVDQMINRVKQELVSICNYRNDNSLNYLR